MTVVEDPAAPGAPTAAAPSPPAASGPPSHPPGPGFHGEDAARESFVRALFDATAADYDRINRLFSLGTGVRHRRRALIEAGADTTALDADAAFKAALEAAELSEKAARESRAAADARGGRPAASLRRAGSIR